MTSTDALAINSALRASLKAADKREKLLDWNIEMVRALREAAERLNAAQAHEFAAATLARAPEAMLRGMAEMMEVES